jgi:hypothetical protein
MPVTRQWPVNNNEVVFSFGSLLRPVNNNPTKNIGYKRIYIYKYI